MDIRIFGGNATSFDAGGVVINPHDAIVTEEANGDYSLEMTIYKNSSCDFTGLIKPLSILYVSVPSKNVPLRHVETTTGTVKRWTASGKGTAKKVLTVTQDQFNMMVDSYMHSTTPSPTYEQAYEYTFKTHSKTVYEYDPVPVYKTAGLKQQSGSVNSGDAINEIESGTGYVFGITKEGTAGYISKDQLHYVGEIQGEVWSIVEDGARVSTAQPFRIYSIEYSNGNKVTVKARHIYFDSMARELHFDEFSNTPLETVCCDLNRNGFITYHCGVTGVYVSGSVYGSNSVIIASQICQEYDLQLVRDGWDAFFLSSDNTERTFDLSTGKNIIEYTATETSDEVATRFIPLVDDEQVTDQIVDSERINDYPIIYSKIIKKDTIEDCKVEIRKQLDKGADLPKVSIDIKCIFGAMQGCSVFDAVTVRDDGLGINYTTKANKIQFDPVRGKTFSVSLGEAQSRIGRVFTSVSGTWQNVK